MSTVSYMFPSLFKCARVEAEPLNQNFVIGLSHTVIQRLNLRAGYLVQVTAAADSNAVPMTVMVVADAGPHNCTLSFAAYKHLTSDGAVIDSVRVLSVATNDELVKDIVAAKQELDAAIMNAKAVARSQLSLTPALLVLLLLWQTQMVDTLAAAFAATVLTHACVNTCWSVMRARFVTQLPLFKRLEARWHVLFASESPQNIKTVLATLSEQQLSDECAEMARVREWAASWPRSQLRRVLHALFLL